MILAIKDNFVAWGGWNGGNFTKEYECNKEHEKKSGEEVTVRQRAHNVLLEY
jgi:hypothetical protein